MIRLPDTVKAWGSPAFESVFRRESEALDPTLLPLQQALAVSSHVSASPFQVLVQRATREDGRIRVKAGIFYSGIIAGCSCADDPTPIGEQTEYCVVEFSIDAATADATVTLLAED
jgi:hypothetical protein